MDYQIIELEETIVEGLTARTNNLAPDMGQVIGGLWERFFNQGIYAGIPHKKNDKTMGIYTDYAGDEKDDYSFLTACEVSEAGSASPEVITVKIPAGKYARFIVKGNMQTAVAEFWQELWKMNLKRSFVCDFEEYQNTDMENAEIHVYIGIKE